MGMVRIRKEVIENWLNNKSTPPKTVEEMAEHIKVSSALLYLIMAGKRQLTPKIQRKLCDLTGYDIGDICYYDRNSEHKEGDK